MLSLCLCKRGSEIITYMDFGCWGETITDWLLGKECAREVSKIKIKSLWVISDTIWDSRIIKTRTSFIEIFIAFTYDPTCCQILTHYWCVLTGTSFLSFRMGTLGGIVDCLSPGPFLSALWGELSPFPRSTTKSTPRIAWGNDRDWEWGCVNMQQGKWEQTPLQNTDKAWLTQADAASYSEGFN